jgi:glycogen debranching enzyme
VLAEFWHWTADDEFVRSMVPHALDGLRWLDEAGDLDGDGFVEYLTRSSHGVKHQAWKDSEDAMVYPDGSRADPPIATCEEQAFVYVATLHLAQMLWSLGERPEARRLLGEARRLRQRFNACSGCPISASWRWPWLPDLVLRDLEVGDAVVTIRFRRTDAGRTAYRVLEKRGRLRVVRQASPWSLTEGAAHRVWDLAASALPGR